MAAIMRLTTGVVYVRSVSGTLSTGAITASGHLLFSPDNTYDIGANGATRPRALYVAGSGTFGGSIIISNGGSFSSASFGALTFSSDGVFRFIDNAGTSFNRLQFGGTTSAFPALKRVSTTVQVRLADDADWGNFNAGIIHASTSFGSSIATGTLLSNDAQSVAVDAVVSLGTGTGFLFVDDTPNGVRALFDLGGGAVSEVRDSSGIFSPTKDNAGTMNVYFDTGAYRFQNKTIASRSVRFVRIGA